MVRMVKKGTGGTAGRYLEAIQAMDSVEAAACASKENPGEMLNWR